VSTRNERLNQNFVSLDALAEQIDFEKSAILSDHGAGEKLICGENHDDEMNELECDNQNFVYLMVFEGMLTLCGYDRLLPIVEQIVKNGKNRKESITQLSIKWRIPKPSAERKYYRGVNDLLTFVSPNKINGQTHF
jgi:ssRNA-specific RNase YbeY (16S rRNA maturation enzyme)